MESSTDLPLELSGQCANNEGQTNSDSKVQHAGSNEVKQDAHPQPESQQIRQPESRLSSSTPPLKPKDRPIKKAKPAVQSWRQELVQTKTKTKAKTKTKTKTQTQTQTQAQARPHPNLQSQSQGTQKAEVETEAEIRRPETPATPQREPEAKDKLPARPLPHSELKPVSASVSASESEFESDSDVEWQSDLRPTVHSEDLQEGTRTSQNELVIKQTKAQNMAPSNPVEFKYAGVHYDLNKSSVTLWLAKCPVLSGLASCNPSTHVSIPLSYIRTSAQRESLRSILAQASRLHKELTKEKKYLRYWITALSRLDCIANGSSEELVKIAIFTARLLAKTLHNPIARIAQLGQILPPIYLKLLRTCAVNVRGSYESILRLIFRRCALLISLESLTLPSSRNLDIIGAHIGSEALSAALHTALAHEKKRVTQEEEVITLSALIAESLNSGTYDSNAKLKAIVLPWTRSRPVLSVLDNISSFLLALQLCLHNPT